MVGLLKSLMFGSADDVDHETMVEAVKTRSSTIVDVREVAEFSAGHIDSAINIPLSRFEARKVPGGKPVIVYCLNGARSAMAKRMLQAAGVSDVRNYRPGYSTWRLHR